MGSQCSWGLRRRWRRCETSWPRRRQLGGAAGFQFPVAGVQLEFHVGVTKTGEGKAGVKFYVVELGGSGSYAREEIQTVTVTLGAPVDHNGDPVKIYRGSAQMP